MYPIEYKWTQKETVVTTINIDDVKASILNDQSTINDPEVIQLKRKIISVFVDGRYSKNIFHDKIVEMKSKKVDTTSELLSPNILPKKIQ